MSEGIAIAAIGAAGAILSAYFAHRAEKNSRPVSNGFAGKVIAHLEGLTAQHQQLHEDVREVRSTLIKHIAQDHND